MELERYRALAERRTARLLASRDRPPVLREPAWHGIAGRIISTCSQTSEAAPAAMLVTLLSVFGAMVGRGAHVLLDRPHYPALFTVIVGRTGMGRKGTSWAAMRPFLEAADPGGQFLKGCVLRGIQSGEALISAAAEAPAGSGLLLIEEEYARLLTASAWPGNTLSATFRAAWDGEPLAARTKDSLVQADRHVAMVGHITAEELAEKRGRTDEVNGMANRMLHVFAERPHLLPEPRPVPADAVLQAGDRLRAALEFARSAGQVGVTDAFASRWRAVYCVLETQRMPSMTLQALRARATAQVRRLSLIYALLDGCATIDRPHLDAALAVWDYCEASMVHLFGVAANPRVEKLYAALVKAGADGLTRTQISALFAGKLPASDITEAVAVLVGDGRARQEPVQTDGRPAMRLVAIR